MANSGFSFADYSDAEYQKYKINLDGLEGFGANYMSPSGGKAGTIGGIFGPVVEVNNKDE